MRRFPALLVVAGLAVAPASAAAGPSTDPWSSSQTTERFEWSTSKGRLGVLVMSLTPELRKHLGAAEDRGVIVARVEPGSPADAAGIQVGDVIVEVHQRKIDSAADVLSALDDMKKGQQVAVELVRDGKARSVEATLSDDAPAGVFGARFSHVPWMPEMPDWMPPFGANQAWPFAESSWFRDWMRPFEPKETPPSDVSNWLRKLRQLLQPSTSDHVILGT